jgi:hypothetical protein
MRNPLRTAGSIARGVARFLFKPPRGPERLPQGGGVGDESFPGLGLPGGGQRHDRDIEELRDMERERERKEAARNHDLAP